MEPAVETGPREEAGSEGAAEAAAGQGADVNAAAERVVISQLDALRAGMTYFYTGKPCKNGHLSKRYAMNGRCYQCSNIAEFIEPQIWPRDDHTRREPVIDPLDGRVIRLVGWRGCMCCRRSFFSADVKRVRICDECKHTRSGNAERTVHLPRVLI